MTDRLEIASRVLAWMVHEHNSPDVAARESLFFADALIAAHEATVPKAEALPEDDECWVCRRESAPIIIGCAASEIINLRAAKQRYIDAMPPRLPDDAPVMEWRVGVQKVCRMEGYYWIMRADCGDSMARFDADDHSVKGEAECDLPAVRAAAEAYSAAKGCKAVFTGEGAGDDR